MHRPYIRYLGSRSGFKVYLVDGSWIRDNEEIEFTNFGSYKDFPLLIPKRELWLDREFSPGEREYFLSRMLSEISLRSEGFEEEAYESARRIEVSLRKSSGKDVKKSLWKVVDGFAVWIVDGEEVRDRYYVDWTQGGHFWRYPFIPKSEIWIDDDLAKEERADVLAHELSEVVFMRDGGMDYDTAHARASMVEGIRRSLK